MFRPGYIQPLHGVRTKTKWYGSVYGMMGPLYPVWKLLFPKYVTTTECLGRAMLNVAKRGALKSVLEMFYARNPKALIEALHSGRKRGTA